MTDKEKLKQGLLKYRFQRECKKVHGEKLKSINIEHISDDRDPDIHYRSVVRYYSSHDEPIRYIAGSGSTYEEALNESMTFLQKLFSQQNWM